MKTTSLLLSGWLIAAALSTTGLALTVEQGITPAYVREHPKEFSVEVTKGKDGLIHFAIRRTLEERMYLVANLTVRHEGKVIVSSSTPSYAKKHDNTFYFSISPEDTADSEFELGESALGSGGDEDIPVVGTNEYKFRLRDFVPEDLLKLASNK